MVFLFKEIQLWFVKQIYFHQLYVKFYVIVNDGEHNLVDGNTVMSTSWLKSIILHYSW